MRQSLLLVAALGFAASLSATDVSGNWTGSMSSGNSAGDPNARLFLHFQQGSDAVTGTLAYMGEASPVQIEKPEIKGDQLTFEVHDNPKRVVRFRFTLTEGALTGEASSGDRVIPITLVRPN